MTWFKVDDQFHSHRKVIATDPAALGLWVIAGSWVSANLTDGFVPDAALLRLLPGASKLARKLVAAGLWERDDTGYRFHDWHQANPTAEKENARKADQARRQAEFRERQKKRRDASSNASRNASSNGATNAVPTRPPLKGERVGGAPQSGGAAPPTRQIKTTTGRLLCEQHHQELPCISCASDARVPDAADPFDPNAPVPDRDSVRARLAANRSKSQTGPRRPALIATPATAEDVAYTEAYRQLVGAGVEEPTDAQVRRAMESARHITQPKEV